SLYASTQWIVMRFLLGYSTKTGCPLYEPRRTHRDASLRRAKERLGRKLGLPTRAVVIRQKEGQQ
ncbi:hypothetical protein, partial [Streptomyces hydrogenans]|uniref:hypothetical protein n=1 Tax=Streptomyces hydrogenans TaxID=1873719 RepID=UPI001CFDC658